MSRIREDWQVERKLLNRWAIWCLHGNERDIHRICGLTWAASPYSIMRRIYENGAVATTDVTGYAAEPPHLPDEWSAQVDEFMAIIAIVLPDSHAALIARHARVVRGQRLLIRAERWIARSLYGLSVRHSVSRLAHDCECGYGALHRWLSAAKRRAP